LERIPRILLLKFMLFDALDHSLEGCQLSFVDLILKQQKTS
jgi:hypothetical protein